MPDYIYLSDSRRLGKFNLYHTTMIGDVGGSPASASTPMCRVTAQFFLNNLTVRALNGAALYGLSLVVEPSYPIHPLVRVLSERRRLRCSAWSHPMIKSRISYLASR